jgi:hypothetical protein
VNRSIAALVFSVLLAVQAAAATQVGAVARVQGVCTGTVEGETRVLVKDAPVYLDEEIATGADARLAVNLDDGTVLTIGENARLTIDAFVYDPAGQSTLHATVGGAFRFVSGAMTPEASRTASVTTPVALIGVRGTDFWGGPIDGAFGVALFEGAIAVTSGGVTRILEAPGFGVDVSPGATPEDVTTWPEEKVNRALATVAFR